MPDSLRPVLSTYRLQLGPDLTLDAAIGVLPYLRRLGVSHVYCSPVLQAAPGSTHGYDVVDHQHVSRELGGEEAWERFCQAAHDHGLGVVLDIVPNHMAIAGRRNRLWWDLLENGASSRYATYFDVAWRPPEPRLRNTILAPVLGDHYGRCLERGELSLHREGGRILVRYYEHEFPVALDSLTTLLRQVAQAAGSEAVAGLAARCSRLPELHPSARTEAIQRDTEKEAILEALGEVCDDPVLAAALDAELAAIAADPDREDDLLRAQHYRLARWQVGAQDVDYRRFFDIQTLAGLRVEDEDVFAESHRLVLRWCRQGLVDGLRVDHVDGLRDPEVYLRRLAEGSGRPIWVEKILERTETVPGSWPIAGTTGYEVGALVQEVLLDPAGEEPLERLWARVTDDPATWEELTVTSRLELLDTALGADLGRLAAAFVRVCEANRRFRDFTRPELTDTLRSVLARFPSYRSYVRSEGPISEADAAAVADALEAARAARPDLDGELFDLLHGVLLRDWQGDQDEEFVARFQQTADPVRAKGIEDTAGYRYHRLAALAEVGGDPGWFGLAPEAFVARLHERAEQSPQAMVTAMTHDSKRGEDVRWRIGLLTEIPDRWEKLVLELCRLGRPHRTGQLPDRPAEYLFFQTLVGAWPISAERARDYALKSAREAKARTSWIAPDEAYEGALLGYVDGCLADPEFVAAIERFAAELAPAAVATGLAAKLLLLTAPGVVDTYQGSELWDLRLVDPDNRGPVDFEARAGLLEELATLSAEEVLARADQGLPKLLVTERALRLRRELPGAFLGPYDALPTHGAQAPHLLAVFRREPDPRSSRERVGSDAPAVVALVPRLVTQLGEGWGETDVELPEGEWVNVLTGEPLRGGRRRVAELLARFPVALLRR